MDVGSEISNKIRSAIKAKLVELNAYVDEELPDYIMVMVANKKSQLQMSEDLGLFLGTNTEKFTTWLHGLLQKLQSITSDAGAVILASTSCRTDSKSSEKIKSREQAGETSSKHKRHNEKPVTDDNKSKKRQSDDGSEEKKEKKRRKSDQDKKSNLKSGDDAKTKQVPEAVDHPDVTSCDTVASTDNVSTKTISLSEANATSDKDNFDSIVRDVLQPENTASEQEENRSVILDVENNENEPQAAETSDTKQASSTVDISDIQVEEDDLTELLLTENDELTKELEQETVVVLPSRKSESGKATVIQHSLDAFSTKPKKGTTSVAVATDSTKDNSLRSSRPRAVTSPIRQTGRRSAVVRAVEPRSSELLTRKRRGPVSVVGAISRDSDEEEGYDPRNPAVGNVASIVKVTARKSSIPPKLQANKSLLLKAMTEAEKSVENQRRVAITPIRPFMRSEGRDRDRDRDRRGHSSSSSSRDSRRHSPTPRLAQASLRQAVSQPRTSRHSPPVYIPTRKVQPAPRVEGSERVGIVSKSRRQEAVERAWMDREEVTAPSRKSIKPDKAASIVNFVIETERDMEENGPQQQSKPEVRVKKEPVSPKRKLTIPEPSITKQSKTALDPEIDSRIVEYEPEMVPSPVEKSVSESGSQGVPALLEDMDQEEFLLDQDVLELTESSTALLEEDHRQAMIKEKPKDRTRFVVTLDGVDNDQYDVNPMETEIIEEEMEVDKMQAVKMNEPAPPPIAAPQFIPQPKDAAPVLISPPKIQPLNINLKDSDEEGESMEVEVTPLKRAKMLERCKFWPACVNGAACDYHHPTLHCKTFPLCKFGDKCLYIHPNCRFDSKCLRPDCPYTHSSLRSIPSFQVPYMKPVYRAPQPPPLVMPAPTMSSAQCKFYPNCSNMSCPFYHPKPCRFGLACKNKEKGCLFYHPPLPTMDKLTWVAAKDSVVSAAASFQEAKKVN